MWVGGGAMRGDVGILNGTANIIRPTARHTLEGGTFSRVPNAADRERSDGLCQV